MDSNAPVIAITGASGAPYARRLLQFFHDEKRPAHLLMTDSARQVIEAETGISLGETPQSIEKGLADFIGPRYNDYVRRHDLRDWNSPLASGSVKTGPMVVVPCSVHSLAAIAQSFGSNLLERRADIMLKERKKLVIVFRETPVNSNHLEHLLRLSQMGAVILPAMPGFYHHPKTIDDLIDFVVGRILDCLEIPNALYKRWQS